MYASSREYFINGVLTEHDGYRLIRQNRQVGLSKDIKSAAHTAELMFHLSEFVFKEFSSHLRMTGIKTAGDYQKHLVKKCPEFSIVMSFANAHKHHTLDRKNRIIDSVDQIISLVVITEYKDEQGIYSNLEKEIHIKSNDGSTKVVHECFELVRSMWWSELFLLGVFGKIPESKQIAVQIPRREDSDVGIKLDLEMRAGEGFHQVLLLKRFNYETMTSEPVDLTGYKFKGSVRHSDP